MPKVSICIPSYNGSQTLRETLENLISQIADGVEIVICDDRSRDDTFLMAKEYEKKYPFVRAFQNEKNLGMDRNFAQAVAHATGEFVWLSGQDDIFGAGAISKFFDIVKNHPDVKLMYFNYQLLSGDLSKEVDSPPLSLESDMLFENSEQYFKVVNRAPSFLAATVMKREFWARTPIEIFLDTHYVQVGVWLQNCLNSKVYVVASPRFIGCRVPEDSWKYKSGQMLFEIFTGKYAVYKTVYDSNNSLVPESVIKDMEHDYFHRFIRKTIIFKSTGFVPDDKFVRIFSSLVRSKIALHFYYLPILHFPKQLASVIYKLYLVFRKFKPLPI